MNYTYPDFVGVTGTPDAIARAISKRVQELYGGVSFGSQFLNLAATSSLSAPTSSAPPEPAGLVQARSISVPSKTVVHHDAPPHPGPNEPDNTHPTIFQGSGSTNPDTYNEWTARIRCKQYELSGSSFTVYIFLGHVPEDPKEWHKSPQTVGRFHAFVNLASEECENCQRHAQGGAEIEGFVHLNRGIVKALRARGAQPDWRLEPDVVKPYLKENLHWAVRKVRLWFHFISLL